MTNLIEYRTVWTQQPTNHNVPQVVFVEAENATDAHKLVRDYVERMFGITRIVIEDPKEVQPLPAGRILADRCECFDGKCQYCQSR